MLFIMAKGQLEMVLLNWQQHQRSEGLQTRLDGEMGLECDLKSMAVYAQ